MTAAHVAPFIGKPTPSVVAVTPEIAERWLGGNSVNRPIRSGKVNRYAGDMLAGRWTISESAICFSPSGRLLNGQHRLLAVIQSGASIPMLIMRGVPEAAMENMDTGAKRTAADALRLDGESNSSLLASTARLALIFTDGRIYKDRKVQDTSNAEQREFIDDNPDLRASVAFTSNIRKALDLTPTVIAVAHWQFSRAAGADDADAFFTALASRVGLQAGSPILALDSRMREVRKNQIRVTHRDELYVVVKAWNYWRTGRRVRTLPLKPRSADARIPAIER